MVRDPKLAIKTADPDFCGNKMRFSTNRVSVLFEVNCKAESVEIGNDKEEVPDIRIKLTDTEALWNKGVSSIGFSGRTGYAEALKNVGSCAKINSSLLDL